MGQFHGVGWSAAVAVCLAAGTATAAPMPAREADALVDTIGVNIHLHYTGGVYDTGFDAIIAPKLAALKIRHVRDGAYTYPEASADSFYYVRARALAALGIRFDLLTSMDTKNGDTTDFDRLADVFAWCDGAVASFEGVNEPNIQGVADWIAQTKAVQESLYTTVKGDAALAGCWCSGRARCSAGRSTSATSARGSTAATPTRTPAASARRAATSTGRRSRGSCRSSRSRAATSRW